MAAKSKCAASAPHLPEAVRYPPSGSKARSARIACPKAPPAPSRPKTMPAASFCCNARIHSSLPVSSASSADTVAAFAVERESLIRVSLIKIPDRLKDKKDLQLVANALRNLARYLYSIIPELSSEEGNRNVQVVGGLALKKFAEDMGQLPRYRAEQRAEVTKEKRSRKLIAALAWFVGLFSHENLLLRFAIWWAFSQTATLVILWIACSSVPALRLDSTL